MPYRVAYRDATDATRLLSIAETPTDALLLIDKVTADVPMARGRLTAVVDPMLGLNLDVIQPPQTLETAEGRPVLYLGGTIAAGDNWQAAAITALRPQSAIILNPRRERATRAEHDSEASVGWRRLHLFFADVALYWFADGDPDPMAMLEMGMLFDSSVPLVVGASPRCTRRTALAAHLRYLDETATLHDTLDTAVTAAATFLENRTAQPLSLANMLSEPAAIAWSLEHIIKTERYRDVAERLDDLAGEAGRAGGVSFEPLLLARIYLAVDRLRLDGADPLGWAQLHDIAAALRVLRRPD